MLLLILVVLGLLYPLSLWAEDTFVPRAPPLVPPPPAEPEGWRVVVRMKNKRYAMLLDVETEADAIRYLLQEGIDPRTVTELEDTRVRADEPSDSVYRVWREVPVVRRTAVSTVRVPVSGASELSADAARWRTGLL